ncbi:hypothetical protein QBC36DRAFT_297776 [Triangularia setosa]|uniref:Kelch repeat protein n=1 Tax=Triangularia setosa TaxID=2587417 RepID=A0AAN6WE81_9PEZI|nr:hypothetical protein QBC36DRAFT_297776 [Podospora setosa]
MSAYTIRTLLYVVLCQWLHGAGLHGVRAELSDIPSRSNFVRRSGAGVTLIGSYLYIDGGEISQREDGQVRGRLSNPVNTTISIDMSVSWKSESVAMRSIPRLIEGVESRSREVIWTNSQAGEFYIWGGYVPHELGGVSSQDYIWKFTADGDGGGKWSQETPTNSEVLAALQQTQDGAFTVAHDKGFVLGGVMPPAHSTLKVVPDTITWDFKSKTVENVTRPGFHILDREAMVAGSSAMFVPGYNRRSGVVLLLGGHILPVGGNATIEQSQPLDLRNLTFFDPITHERYWQLTTGYIPPSPRTRACLAGPFRTPGGNYDLFFFGGENEAAKTRYDDAYVLSLPGFVWTRVPSKAPGGPRSYHSCVAVGRNQVISVGGTPGGGDNDWKSVDPIPQGLLLFNMTSLRWQTEYVVEGNNVAGYQRAASIVRWYIHNPLEKIQWSSRTVEGMFRNLASNNATTAPEPELPTDTTTGNPNGTDITIISVATDAELSSGSTPLTTIVGGTVGAVVVLILLAGLGWFHLRSKKKRVTDNNVKMESNNSIEFVDRGGKGYYLNGHPTEIEGTTAKDVSKPFARYEIEAMHLSATERQGTVPKGISEHYASQELDASHGYHELMDSTSVRRLV